MIPVRKNTETAETAGQTFWRHGVRRAMDCTRAGTRGDRAGRVSRFRQRRGPDRDADPRVRD